MQTQISHEHTAGGSGPGQDSPLVAVILYDEAESGRQAMRALHSATDGFAAAARLEVRLWRIDILAAANLRREAREDLKAAALLILSMKDAARLPSSLCEWMADVVRRKQGSGSAVVAHCAHRVAVSPASGPSLQGIESVRQAAEEAGLEFLLLGACRNRLEPDTSWEAIHRRADTVTPLLEEILHRPDSPARGSRLNLPCEPPTSTSV